MGLSLGAAQGGQNAQSTSATSGNVANTYSPWQTLLQGNLGGTLSTLLSGMSTGTNSPDVQAVGNQNANQIDQTYQGVQQNLNKTLAARGFGQSGATGSTALQTQLGRAGALANNTSNTAGLQLNQNASFLTDSLMAAFNSMGQTNAQSTAAQSSGSEWGTSEGVGVGIPGV